MTIVASIQYQAMPEHVEDAFYRLVDPQAQITSYVFDGRERTHIGTACSKQANVHAMLKQPLRTSV